MIVYKVIVTLIVLTILDRCIVPFYYNTLKDCLGLSLVAIAILVNDFQIFNQIMLFTIPIFIFIVFVDSCLRSRLRYDERQELAQRASSALFAAAHFQNLYEQLKKKYDEVYEEKELTYDRLASAMRWLYSVESKEDMERDYPELAKQLEYCLKVYSEPQTRPYTSPDLYSDMSSAYQIKHLIRELKRIKKDNTLGEKFDIFLENEINFLEVALQNVSSRVNNKRFKFK